MRGALFLGLGIGVATGACSPNYVVVTVNARPAVHDAASITVALANAGTTRMDTLMLNGKPFPVTFSISAPGRQGDLALTVDARDAGGLIVGHGSAMTTLTAPKAEVMLDSTDFVVNTDYAGDQFPTDDSQATGFQLAALPDGTWTVVFRDACMQGGCNVFARRFDPAGKPATTQAAAGTNPFVVTARTSDMFTEPAVASGQTATIALWNFTDAMPAATGVACRAISAGGALAADQTAIAGDIFPEVVSIAALPGGDFVASWNAFPAMGSGLEVHAAVVKPDCSAPGSTHLVSTADAVAERTAVTSSVDHVLFTWVVSGALHARMASSAGAVTGTFLTADTPLVPQTATDQVVHARAAPVAGGGFALAVRWIAKSSSAGPGKIELYQVTAAGALTGSPALVTDQSGSNFYDDEGFGFASRPDGTVLVAWHVCGPSGDMCTLSGRILKANGEPVTGVFAIPTTTGNSQKRPSVVGLPDGFAVVWSDSSGKPPDGSGQAVRGRIVYPPVRIGS